MQQDAESVSDILNTLPDLIICPSSSKVLMESKAISADLTQGPLHWFQCYFALFSRIVVTESKLNLYLVCIAEVCVTMVKTLP